MPETLRHMFNNGKFLSKKAAWGVKHGNVCCALPEDGGGAFDLHNCRQPMHRPQQHGQALVLLRQEQ